MLPDKKRKNKLAGLLDDNEEIVQVHVTARIMAGKRAGVTLWYVSTGGEPISVVAIVETGTPGFQLFATKTEMARLVQEGLND